MSYLQGQTKVTLTELARLKASGEKIAVLTCYDSSFAALLDRCAVDVLLVGDSLGNVLQGEATTLPVTLEHMVYHTRCVARGLGSQARSFLAADMPWGTYQESREQAMRNAAQLMAAGAQMVKLEGGAYMAETVRFLVERGVPVWAHIGLTPQSVHQLGGYRIQGKGEAAAQRQKADAVALQDAGASMLLIEMIPATLGAELTRMLAIPTIGIGAGLDCSGQVLVLHDMLGVFPGKRPRFVRNFMDGAASIQDAVERYVRAVKDGSFPAPENAY